MGTSMMFRPRSTPQDKQTTGTLRTRSTGPVALATSFYAQAGVPPMDSKTGASGSPSISGTPHHTRRTLPCLWILLAAVLCFCVAPCYAEKSDVSPCEAELRKFLQDHQDVRRRLKPTLKPDNVIDPKSQGNRNRLNKPKKKRVSTNVDYGKHTRGTHTAKSRRGNAKAGVRQRLKEYRNRKDPHYLDGH